MSNHRDPDAGVSRHLHDTPAGLTLPGTRSNRADGDNRDCAVEHRGARAKDNEVRSSRIGDRRPVHHVGVGHVTLGKDDLPQLQAFD